MHSYIHTYMHIAYMHSHIHTHTYKHTYKHLYTYTCTHTVGLCTNNMKILSVISHLFAFRYWYHLHTCMYMYRIWKQKCIGLIADPLLHGTIFTIPPKLSLQEVDIVFQLFNVLYPKRAHKVPAMEKHTKMKNFMPNSSFVCLISKVL